MSCGGRSSLTGIDQSLPQLPRLRSEHLLLGAGILALVCDWDAWVSRRVDSFWFAGDDERVLARRQSMDFKLPELSGRLERATDALGGVPVPVTFVNKWRLPQFSLRDETEKAIPLVSRRESILIASGMLIALGHYVVKGELIPAAEDLMPTGARRLLRQVAAAESPQAIRLCARLGQGARSGLTEAEEEWQRSLAASEIFMSLAYELARGFVVLALFPASSSGRRILKFSYNSYVVPATHDRAVVRLAHLLRWVAQRAGDAADSVAWPARRGHQHEHTGRIVLATLCEGVSDRVRAGGLTVACALATLTGPEGRRRSMRLRPNGAVAFEHTPPGWYLVQLTQLSGFELDTQRTLGFKLGEGATERLTIAAHERDSAAPATLAGSPLARPAWKWRNLARGFAWYSKPLAIRVRVGDGGTYTCEFEAPAGLHVTRARLIANGEPEGDGEPARELDLVLASAQRANLHTSSQEPHPAAGYAYFNLRPRVETIVRPAFWTAWVAFAALTFLAGTWRTHDGFHSHGPLDSSVLLVLVLGAPTALVAYFAQAVPSRVTNAMLYGLRLLALLPAVLTVAAGAVMLVGERTPWAHPALWAIDGSLVGAIVMLAIARRYAEHPREQRSRAQAHSRERESRRPARAAGTRVRASKTSAIPTCPARSDGEAALAIRDRMLERAEGLSRSARHMLLSQPSLTGRELKVPPALYFDSAETPPTFVGLGCANHRNSVWSQVHELMSDANTRVETVDAALRSERPRFDSPSGPTQEARPQ